MKLGTHNSGTCYDLVWWQRPFAWPLHLLSRCQSRSIWEQLEDGVKLFNFQITNYNGTWVFSHGLCIYDADVILDIIKLKTFATKESPIYFNLYLDKNFFLGQDIDGFREFVKLVQDVCKDSHLHMLYAWVEGTDIFLYESNININSKERYWTSVWGESTGNWIDKIPLPKRHAKKYNSVYRKTDCDYLMLDFYEL
jgi:hypothetical protein